jgi:hypothetical protein
MIFQPCLPIVWVKDRDATLLVDQESRCSWMIKGNEALIWDLLQVKIPYPRTVLMLSHILSLSLERAERLLLDQFRCWQKLGIGQMLGDMEHG